MASLTISFEYGKIQRSEDIAQIFKIIGHNLNHLKLSDPSGFISYDTEFYKDCMIALPNLKSVDIDFNYSIIINKLLRTLSDIGVIEELRISGGVFHDENENSPLLILEIICFARQKRVSSLLNLLTRSQMSSIHTFQLRLSGNAQNIVDDDLLKFIQSKKTLKLIRFYNYGNLRIAFIHQVIDLLKKPFTPKRSFLKFEFWCFNEEEKAIDLLNKKNQHLIKVTQLSSFEY